MSKFKKFASKLGHYALDGLDALVEAAEESNRKRAAAAAAASSSATSQPQAAARAPAAPAPAAKPKPAPVEIDIDPIEWESYCTHEAIICSNCLAAVKACIQSAIDAGVPGGFNFATRRVDPDVAACNNACPHKKINDCCATCLFSFMGRKTNEVNNLIAVSNAAVGHLNNAAAGVGTVGAPIGTMRQNLHEQSMRNQEQRAEFQRQMAAMQAPVFGGFGGGGGGTWGRQQQIANGMVWDPPVYTVNNAYSQFRW
ncbi:hypothetical protein TWF696_001407 [Orbilia brochopaga]|uniref:Uncharacterized protein n=1 Tax=Orbilia brochopaga TaxID=3140254 RepID=A0AAV9U8J6_9PEZI